MRKTWKIWYHQNSLTLNILPLFCAKIGREIVLSAPYYRQVITLSLHNLQFKAKIKAVPKKKIYDKWSHKTPYQKSNIRTFRFSRLQSQLQGNDWQSCPWSFYTSNPVHVCASARSQYKHRFSLHPHIIVLSEPLPLPLEGQTLSSCAMNSVPVLIFLLALSENA